MAYGIVGAASTKVVAIAFANKILIDSFLTPRGRGPADPRLCCDPKARDGCIRQELAAGVIHPKFDVSPILAQLGVFSPNDLFDDRLCDLIPMLRLAAVANADRDFGTTKDIALVGPLAETDRLIECGDAATLAKIAALHVVCVGHGPHRS